jgi:hypothetical protein
MAASQVSKTAWLLEGCNCDTVCPCIFFLDPDEGNCHVTCAWHMQKGNYGNTDLNNLNVVAMFNSPGNMFTGPKWKTALYIDERATQQQKDLITKIYSRQGVYAALKLTPLDNFILFLRAACQSRVLN